MTDYTQFPREELIAELGAWEKKFKSKVREGVKEERARLDKETFKVRAMVLDLEKVLKEKNIKEIRKQVEALKKRTETGHWFLGKYYFDEVPRDVRYHLEELEDAIKNWEVRP